MLNIATEFESYLKENNYTVNERFDDILMEKFAKMTSPDVSHILVDEYLARPPETSSFITVFGYKW
ncbi:hypothetical protein [Desulfotalea psychrophila]|uniref:hypothetical protein n=1 Tax=Desulfotalea psychrophila TaxID=84980 RepID=UPI00031C09B2|nr:hypothetical protein [Desulfotalea psychrophila]